MFGRQAETTAQYLKKGSSVLVEGSMQTRSWEGGDGVKKYRTEIVADRVQFGPRKEGGAVAADTRSADAGSQDKDASGGFDAIEYPENEINPDDIPF